MERERFEALAESVRLMETLPEGLVLLDDEQRILAVNRSGEAHLQRLAQAAVGDKLTHLGGQSIHPMLTPQISEMAFHEIATEQPSPHIFEVRTYSVQDGAAWLLVLMDMTEVRQLQRLAQQQDRLAVVGQLAAGIAHDFNNILTPIILYTDIVMGRLPPASSEQAQLAEVLRAAHRAKALVRQIMTFSHPQSQSRTVIRLQPILAEVLDLLRGIFPTTIEIRQQIDPRAGAVLAEPAQIHQILMNLCTNAYQAMRAHGGVLSISLDAVQVDGSAAVKHIQLKEGWYIRLTVSDTGHGMDPVTQQRIFEPFFTTKAVGEGTGMGLSVVYGIVNRYEGAITVVSAPGKGATFQVYLPQVERYVDLEEESEWPVLRGSERILVVDDEEAIAFVTKAILENLGYVVTAQTNSMMALTIFRSAPQSFDLVITDLTMPRLTGPELAAELLHSRPDLPIVLITGTSEPLTPEMVKTTGARAHLMKPFSASDLSRTIRHVLDKV